MYFWRIDALKTQLLQAPLSDRQVLPYLVLFCALTAAVGLIPVEAMMLGISLMVAGVFFSL